jgi:hypothetical protein
MNDYRKDLKKIIDAAGTPEERKRLARQATRAAKKLAKDDPGEAEFIGKLHSAFIEALFGSRGGS